MCDKKFDICAWIFDEDQIQGGNANRAAHRVQVGFKRGNLSYIDENVNLSAAQSKLLL